MAAHYAQTAFGLASDVLVAVPESVRLYLMGQGPVVLLVIGRKVQSHGFEARCLGRFAAEGRWRGHLTPGERGLSTRHFRRLTGSPWRRPVFDTSTSSRHPRVGLAHRLTSCRGAAQTLEMGFRSSTMREAAPLCIGSSRRLPHRWPISASTWGIDGSMKPYCRQGFCDRWPSGFCCGRSQSTRVFAELASAS